MEKTQEQLPTSTTDPRKPNAEVPSAPPLSTTATLETPLEAMTITPKISLDYLMKMGLAFFLESFVISANDNIGKLLYTWSMLDPFKGMNIANAPWPLFDAIYSRFYKMDPVLILRPVKIGDTPVFIDIFQNYQKHEQPTNLEKVYLGDNSEIEITDSTPIAIPVGNYWLRDKVHTKHALLAAREPPYYAPRTQITIRVKNQYAPTAVHPDNFSVMVFIKPGLSCQHKEALRGNTKPWFLAS